MYRHYRGGTRVNDEYINEMIQVYLRNRNLDTPENRRMVRERLDVRRNALNPIPSSALMIDALIKNTVFELITIHQTLIEYGIRQTPNNVQSVFQSLGLQNNTSHRDHVRNVVYKNIWELKFEP